ncbi:helix-turn-helix transcriptional regulator [Megalodesulfovibrio gigas]|nr:AlpA family phage regulatory protein [Megalodesulfovibrio gigas]
MQATASNRLLRLPDVLSRVPVSKSTWFAGIKAGRFPKPIAVGERARAWREADINAVCDGTFLAEVATSTPPAAASASRPRRGRPPKNVVTSSPTEAAR